MTIVISATAKTHASISGRSRFGPLSSLNVVLHSRFGIDSFTMARWNAKYVVGVLLLSTVLLPLCQFLSEHSG